MNPIVRLPGRKLGWEGEENDDGRTSLVNSRVCDARQPRKKFLYDFFPFDFEQRCQVPTQPILLEHVHCPGSLTKVKMKSKGPAGIA